MRTPGAQTLRAHQEGLEEEVATGRTPDPRHARRNRAPWASRLEAGPAIGPKGRRHGATAYLSQSVAHLTVSEYLFGDNRAKRLPCLTSRATLTRQSRERLMSWKPRAL